MSSIHTNIRVLREEARLSQEEFAEQLNVDVQTVKLWEKGKIDPSDDEITKMCPILRIHKEDFLERDILAERTNANSKMKRGQHRSNYDWYYGNRLNMAFYVSYLILIPIIMIVTFILVGNIFGYLYEYMMSFVCEKVVIHLRCEVFNKILHLPLSYIDSHRHGDMVSLIISDIEPVSYTHLTLPTT